MIFLTGLLLPSIIRSCEETKKNDWNFAGSEYWDLSFREQCQKPLNLPYSNPTLRCYSYFRFLYVVNVEVLNVEPPLLVYRQLADEKNIADFINDVKQKNLEEQTVLPLDDANESTSKVSNSRRANGTIFAHTETSGVAYMFHKAQMLIPALNLESSELWQVLSYNAGGHYAPHYDYLSYLNEGQYDWWMKNYGNRYATFLLILKTADEGGGTVFPVISMTVEPEPGDVILWLNQAPNGQVAEKSLHGACPILKGTKIAATLWIRELGQWTKQYTNNETDIRSFVHV